MSWSRLVAGLALLLAAAPPAAAAGEAERGAAVFARCAGCHSVSPGENRIGPSLAGVVGRKAGGAPGFRYSPALRGAPIVWTRETLDAFLQSPRTLVPGTRMLLEVPGQADRRALVAYLAAQR